MGRESSPPDQINLIIGRLAQQTSLRIPASLSRNDEPITQETRFAYLRNLLTHDPGVFLERYGDDLLEIELEYFIPLRRTSYEIDFYMKLLEDKNTSNVRGKAATVASPSAVARKNAAVKNRRLAKLELLEKEGYFKMEAMRSREPYLHHLYIGQYSLHPNAGLEVDNATAAEGEEHSTKLPATEGAEKNEAPPARSAFAQLADTLMDHHDELNLMLRRESEREAYARQEEQSETEEDEDEEEDGEAEGAQVVERELIRNESSVPGDWPAPEELTHEERYVT